jgi:saccharopine dehydrogenase (NADP+, L-glutamate forming)
MSDRIPASGTVHWIGTGLSTGGGLRLLCDHPAQVAVWGRTRERAHGCLARLGLADRAQAHAYDPATLAARAHEGDVVVSMLPATGHATMLRLCLARGAHFACSSYTSDELTALADRAAARGLVVLTEAGLDPGLDHALARALIVRARAVVGDGPATAWFTSYCGGLPAVPNEFRYRFSWAPRGVLSALCSPARYLDDGAHSTVALPWEATRELAIDGETFEAYPNRDSLPFLAQYAFPAGWRPQTFVRGTLRLAGWRAAWAPVFDVLRTGDSALIDALALNLAARYPTGSEDRDRVVLAVALTVQAADGPRWSGRYLLDLVGDGQETAMARCVSLPLALGVTRILDGGTPPGLCRAVPTADEAEQWITSLRAHGIDCALKS